MATAGAGGEAAGPAQQQQGGGEESVSLKVAQVRSLQSVLQCIKAGNKQVGVRACGSPSPSVAGGSPEHTCPDQCTHSIADHLIVCLVHRTAHVAGVERGADVQRGPVGGRPDRAVGG